VLPLLPNQLTVSLSKDSVACIQTAGGLFGRVLKQQHVAITPTTNELPWSTALNKFESLLAPMQIKPKTQLKIILSSDFVRYLFLPQQPISMNFAEQQAYALAAYREVYGTVADAWNLKLHDAAPNQATIVAAIDENLLETLKQIALKYQLKLTSVQPYLMSAFNCLSKQTSKINGYLVVLESERLLLLSMVQGQCQNLRTIAVAADWQVELKSLLMRESLLGDMLGREVFIYAPAQKNTALKAIEGWNVRRVGQAHKPAVEDKNFVLLEGVA
jgi:hypothetical protein